MSYEKREGNLKFSVSQNRYGEWGWVVCVHTGMVDDAEEGPRMIRKGEMPDDDMLIWYVMGHGRARSEREAYAAAGEAIMGISRVVSKLYSAATLGEARASSNAGGEK